MKVIIDRLDHQGRGICYIDEKICFVENTLPGEVVEIEIISNSKKFSEAKVINYVKKSDLRIKPICPYYGQCGGCNLLHINYDEQLKYKYNKVLDVLKRFGNVDEKVIRDIVPSPCQFNYRNKVTLKVDNRVGYYKNKSNTIVHIDKCFLVNDEINNIISVINEFGNIKGIYEIVIKAMSSEDICILIYADNSDLYIDFFNYMKKYVPNIVVYTKNSVANSHGKGNIIARLGNKMFNVNPLSFFQVNLAQTINLYNKVLENVKDFSNSKILDLYCGTGSIGQYVSDYVDEIFGVEIIKEAVVNARENAKLNGVTNSTYYVGDTKVVLNNNKLNADIVIVDPPRAGLDSSVINDLLKINANRIIYVSCDPVTLARDLKLLSDKYSIKEVTPFDMFPNTYHVESVVVLERM